MLRGCPRLRHSNAEIDRTKINCRRFDIHRGHSQVTAVSNLYQRHHGVQCPARVRIGYEFRDPFGERRHSVVLHGLNIWGNAEARNEIAGVKPAIENVNGLILRRASRAIVRGDGRLPPRILCRWNTMAGGEAGFY